jgi:hypothetical protein
LIILLLLVAAVAAKAAAGLAVLELAPQVLVQEPHILQLLAVLVLPEVILLPVVMAAILLYLVLD